MGIKGGHYPVVILENFPKNFLFLQTVFIVRLSRCLKV